MRAAVLDEHGIDCKDVPEPTPGPGYVKIKVAYCGICGSDLPRVLEGTAHHYPIILGHEFSGIICDVGSGVKSVKKGDRVVGVPLIPCFNCNACKSGLYSLCSNYSFIGSRIDGGYAEYVCIPEKNVLKLPDEMDLLCAATIEPCTISRHAFSLVDVKGKTVAIVGSGIIGLFAVQWAKIKGSSSVTLITHGMKKLKVTDTCADYIKSSDNIDCKYDIVIDCAGTNDSIIESLTIGSIRSTIILIGTPRTNVIISKKQWELVNRKELTIIGSWMSYSEMFPGDEWKESVQLMNIGMITVIDEMVSSIISVDEIKNAFNSLNEKRSGRIIIDFEG